MNLKQLRYFCEVIQTGSAKAASEKLFIAPTAISMQLSALEESLGGKLLDRGARPMTLTPLGQFVYPKARELVAAASRLEREAKGVAAGKMGSLSIGFTRSTIFSILPEAVRAMQAAYPDARIDLVETLTEHQPGRLRSGAIQIGIGRSMGALVAEPDLSIHPLFEDPLVAAIPIHHHLASATAIHAREMEKLPYISYPGSADSEFSRQMLSALHGAGVTPDIAHEAKEIHTALGLVAAGLGVAIVGNSVARNNRADIRFVPIVDIKASSTVYALKMRTGVSPLVDAFQKLLDDQILAMAKACAHAAGAQEQQS